MDYVRRAHEWLAENTDFVQFPRERREQKVPVGTPWYWRMLLGYLGLILLGFCCVASAMLACFFAGVLT